MLGRRLWLIVRSSLPVEIASTRLILARSTFILSYKAFFNNAENQTYSRLVNNHFSNTKQQKTRIIDCSILHLEKSPRTLDAEVDRSEVLGTVVRRDIDLVRLGALPEVPPVNQILGQVRYDGRQRDDETHDREALGRAQVPGRRLVDPARGPVIARRRQGVGGHEDDVEHPADDEHHLELAQAPRRGLAVRDGPVVAREQGVDQDVKKRHEHALVDGSAVRPWHDEGSGARGKAHTRPETAQDRYMTPS